MLFYVLFHFFVLNFTPYLCFKRLERGSLSNTVVCKLVLVAVDGSGFCPMVRNQENKTNEDILQQAGFLSHPYLHMPLLKLYCQCQSEHVFILWYYAHIYLLIFKINFSKHHFVNHWLYWLVLGLPQGSRKSFPVWLKDFCLKNKMRFWFPWKKDQKYKISFSQWLPISLWLCPYWVHCY